MKQGIYQITSATRGRCYVGSSVNIEKRWRNHCYYLNLGKHHSPKLQNAWNKYGASDFSFTVLEIVANSDALVECEQAFMDLLKPYFNVKASATKGRLGLPHTQESRRKMSESRKGFCFDDEAKQKMSDSAVRRQQEGRGSLTRGEQVYGAKLTETIVKEIRHLIADRTVTQKQITQLYKVNRFIRCTVKQYDLSAFGGYGRM